MSVVVCLLGGTSLYLGLQGNQPKSEAHPVGWDSEQPPLDTRTLSKKPAASNGRSS